MKTNLLVGTKAISAKVSSIGTRAKNIDADVQLAGLSILAHIDEHGDVTLADKLVAALGQGHRRLALVEWLLAFGKVAKAKGLKKSEIEAGRIFAFDKDRVTDLEGAEAKAWHEFRKEKAVSDAFDAQAQVKALISRLKNAATNGKTLENLDGALAEAKALVTVLEQSRQK